MEDVRPTIAQLDMLHTAFSILHSTERPKTQLLHSEISEVAFICEMKIPFAMPKPHAGQLKALE